MSLREKHIRNLVVAALFGLLAAFWTGKSISTESTRWRHVLMISTRGCGGIALVLRRDPAYDSLVGHSD
jgi:hypothetical protein